jgi:hypothetical protein
MLGWSDLKEFITLAEGSVECPVSGCQQTVPRQRKKFRAASSFQCPDHRIFISPSTFEYAADTESMLWAGDDDLALWKCIKTPGVKRESRMARDNSEDGMTWNVFRYLERHGLTGEFINAAAGEQVARNPRVVYWSFCQTSKKPWQPLLDAATTFGERIERRSEPDIIVDDADLLVFAENKWLSGNRTKPTDPANPKRYDTGDDGWFGKVFKPTTTFQKVAVDAKLYELMRLWLLGSWIAHRAGKRFLLLNIVRAEKETDIEARFGAHVEADSQRRFRRFTWEGLHASIIRPRAGSPGSDRLARYFREKTLGYRVVKGGKAKLCRAFSLPA